MRNSFIVQLAYISGPILIKIIKTYKINSIANFEISSLIIVMLQKRQPISNIKISQVSLLSAITLTTTQEKTLVKLISKIKTSKYFFKLRNCFMTLLIPFISKTKLTNHQKWNGFTKSHSYSNLLEIYCPTRIYKRHHLIKIIQKCQNLKILDKKTYLAILKNEKKSTYPN